MTPTDDSAYLVRHGNSIVPRDAATLPVLGMAARYGLLAFEGVRVYRTHDGSMSPWLLAEHMRRLLQSCEAVGLETTCLADVPQAIDETLSANRISRDCYLLITVSAASPVDRPRPYAATLTVGVIAIGHRRWLASGDGMALAVRSLDQFDESSSDTPVRQLSTYARRRLALTEVRARGYDDVALLNAGGHVMGSSSAAIFVVEHDKIITPPPEDCGLPGIMRAWVMDTAPVLGLAVHAEPLTAERLHQATEVFICGTGIEFACVRTVDDIMLSGWPRYTTTSQLSDELFAQARAD